MVTRVLKELWIQFDRDDLLGLSAQCAYYFLLSLFPFLLFSLSLLGYLPITSEQVMDVVSAYIPEGVSMGMEEHLRSILDIKRGGTLSFGIIFSLFTASGAMDAIVKAVNKAYGLPDRKSFIHSRLLSIVLTVSMLLVVISALVLSVFGYSIGEWMHARLHISKETINLWHILRWTINFVIVTTVFIGIYFFAPNTCINCKDVIPGAVIAALGWQITSLGFSYYVNNWGNYSATYGSLGGVIVLMLWFYLCALNILIGGEINAINYAYKERRRTVG
ncbi:YihY/virulence factor BrkB family protein [Ammoniphilus sp. YIM 78166]|uniref:YihY/virulence factor BrkB family protein n=1 Tax=Ammoniphilus sp. YIM 78166 TaxID=1644106 RepID=UPI00106F59A6|nr:YihY/virulence factor BrkB family protein [Ammoniphilus sp. YIM 78166]